MPLVIPSILYDPIVIGTILDFLDPHDVSIRSLTIHQEVTQEYRLFWSSCSALARTCKALSEIALDTLWRDIWDIKMLLQLLWAFQPARLGGISSDNSQWPARSYMLSGEIYTEEWTRLQSYARRVRRVQCNQVDSKLDPSVFPRLVELCRGKPLFPHLETVVWAYELYIQSELLLFITPTLRQFALVQCPSAAAAAEPRKRWLTLATDRRRRNKDIETTMMRKLAHVAVDLEALSFGEAVIVNSVLDLVSAFKHLRILHAVLRRDYFETGPSLLPSTLLSISYLDKLTELRMDVDSIETQDLIFLRDKPFQRLESLIIEGRASSIKHALLYLTTPRVRSIIITSRKDGGSIWSTVSDTWTEFESLTNLILLRFSLRLRILRITRDLTTGPHRTDNPFSFSRVLAPVLRIAQLQEFSVTLHQKNTVSLSDEDIQDMAASWPQLRILQLAGFGEGGKTEEWAGLHNPDVSLPARPSMLALRHLATHCANLHAVRLPILIVSNHQLDQLPPQSTQLKGYCSLHSIILDIQEPSTVNWFLLQEDLASLFPHLDPVVCYDAWLSSKYRKKHGQWGFILQDWIDDLSIADSYAV
ncbi:hypothetical protein C8Q75DRAFT_804240 [Abortiporus biennis]|nr:hypothetical protein C8Q75DRAFT_804240 [Abortiporus biennis]